MRRWLIAVLVCLTPVLAAARQRVYGDCSQGNYKVNIGGLTSTLAVGGANNGVGTVVASFPSCTVTVYATGTSNVSTIYSDSGGTAKANPFTAASDGTWFFYADNGRYDVQISGANLPSPKSLGDVLAQDFTVGSTLLTNAMAFSATPAFDASSYSLFVMTLTANVTSSTITGSTTGRYIGFQLCQDGTGGHTFAWPASFIGAPTIASKNNVCTNPIFWYDGTNWRLVGTNDLTPDNNTWTGTDTFSNTVTLTNFNNLFLADQYASISSAVTAAGSTGAVILPPTGSSGTYTNPNNINIIDLRGRPDRYKGFVNVVGDCGAKGDGVTDDYTAISTCLTNNPGAHFLFPKMCVQSGSYSCVDFLLSQTLTLGPNQWLDGVTAHYTNNKGTGAPVIKWSVDTTGITIPVASVGAHISNLELKSSLWPSGRWSDSDLTTWPQNSSSDGIYMGATAVIENVDIDGFSRHGINVDGSQNGQQPDLWKVRNVRAGSLGGDGLFLHGGDSNAGFSEGMSVYTSNGWGIRDNSSLGNTHLQPHTNGNHRNSGIAAGSTFNVNAVSRASNVLTVTTATSHGFVNNTWVHMNATNSIGGFPTAGYWKVTSIPTNTTFTIRNVGTDGSAGVGGTAQTADGAGVYATASRVFQNCSMTSGSASLTCTDGNFSEDLSGVSVIVAGAGAAGAPLSANVNSMDNGYHATLNTNASTTVSGAWTQVSGGWSGGPYKASQSSTTTVWINPYQESNQPVSRLSSGSIVIGNNFTGNFDFTYGKPLILQAGSTGEIDAPAGVVRFKSNTDALFNFILQSGVASAQETDLIFYDHNGAAMHSIRANFGGGASGQLDFRDDRIGNIWLAGGGSTNAGTFLRANGSGALDLMSTGTGNMTVFGGSGSNGTTFTNAGATTFSKQIISSLATGTAPFSIASTTLVPNLNTQVLNGVTVSGAAAAGQVLSATSSSAATWQTAKLLNCGTTSTCAQTLQTSLIFANGGPIALSTGTLTVTSMPYTSSTTYVCSADDSTGINGIDVIYNSGSSVTFNGTGSDSIRYTCVGN